MRYSYVQFYHFIFAFNYACKHRFQFFFVPYSLTAIIILAVLLRSRYIFGYSIEDKRIRVYLSYINKIRPLSHLIPRVNRLAPIYHRWFELKPNSVYMSNRGIYSTSEMRFFRLGGLLLFEAILI